MLNLSETLTANFVKLKNFKIIESAHISQWIWVISIQFAQTNALMMVKFKLFWAYFILFSFFPKIKIHMLLESETNLVFSYLCAL